METFVLVDVFRAGKYIEYLCVEQARKEQEAREAEARREQEAREAEAKLERERQTAEQALRRKQAEMSADRSNAWSRRWRAWAVRNPRRRNRRIRKPLRATRRSCRGRRSGTGERRS